MDGSSFAEMLARRCSQIFVMNRMLMMSRHAYEWLIAHLLCALLAAICIARPRGCCTHISLSNTAALDAPDGVPKRLGASSVNRHQRNDDKAR